MGSHALLDSCVKLANGKCFTGRLIPVAIEAFCVAGSVPPLTSLSVFTHLALVWCHGHWTLGEAVADTLFDSVPAVGLSGAHGLRRLERRALDQTLVVRIIPAAVGEHAAGSDVAGTRAVGVAHAVRSVPHAERVSLTSGLVHEVAEQLAFLVVPVAGEGGHAGFSVRDGLAAGETDRNLAHVHGYFATRRPLGAFGGVHSSEVVAVVGASVVVDVASRV